MDPQSRPGEFSPAAARQPVASDPTRTPTLARSLEAGCTFSGVECHDRFGGGHEPGGKVARVLGRECLGLRGGHAAGPRTPPRPSVSGCAGAFDRGRTASQCAATALRYGPVNRGRSGSVANRSVLHPTRLETRTKESNMCASHGALRNPKAQ